MPAKSAKQNDVHALRMVEWVGTLSSMPSFTDPRTGVVWSADTQEALVNLYQKVMKLGAAPTPETPAKPALAIAESNLIRDVPNDVWAEFDQALSAEARLLLIWVKKRGADPFTAEEAVVHLPNTESSGIGGLLSGIRRRSKRLFEDSNAVLTRNPQGREFAMGALLATHDIKPPTRWDRLSQLDDVIEDDAGTKG